MNRQFLTVAMSMTFRAALSACVLAPALGAAAPLVTEIHYNPSASTEGPAEWVEVHNPDAMPVDLSGWKLETSATRSFTIPAGISIPAGGYVVFASSLNLGGQLACNGAAAAWGTAATAPSLGNSSGAYVALKDPANAVVNQVAYIGGGFPTSTNGKAIAVINVALGNADAGNWRHSNCLFGMGVDFGTPGLAEQDCGGMAGPSTPCVEPPDAGPPDAAGMDAGDLDAGPVDAFVPDAALPPNTDVFFSEIYAPTGSSTGQRWVELHNPTSADVDLGGYKLRARQTSGANPSMSTFTIPAGTVLAAGGFLVLGSNATLGGGASCAVAAAGFGSGFTIYISSSPVMELLDGADTVVDAVAFLSAGFPATQAGRSVAVANLAAGNRNASNWRHGDCRFNMLPAYGTPAAGNTSCGDMDFTLVCLPPPDAGSSTSSSGGSSGASSSSSGGPADAGRLLEPLDASGGLNNQAPTLAVLEPQTAQNGPLVTISWQATDPDNDVLGVSILRAPLGTGTSGDELFAGQPAEGTVVWSTEGTPAGRYRVLVRVDDGRGHVVTQEAAGQVEVSAGGTAGLVSIESPRGGEEVGDKLAIRIRSGSPDGTLSVFYDTDSAGLDGTPIAGGLRSTVGITEVSWDVLGVAPGEYFVYAVLEGAGPVASAYSAGSVQIGTARRCGCTAVRRDGGAEGALLLGVAGLVLWTRSRRRSRKGE